MDHQTSAALAAAALINLASFFSRRASPSSLLQAASPGAPLTFLPCLTVTFSLQGSVCQARIRAPFLFSRPKSASLLGSLVCRLDLSRFSRLGVPPGLYPYHSRRPTLGRSRAASFAAFAAAVACAAAVVLRGRRFSRRPLPAPAHLRTRGRPSSGPDVRPLFARVPYHLVPVFYASGLEPRFRALEPVALESLDSGPLSARPWALSETLCPPWSPAAPPWSSPC